MSRGRKSSKEPALPVRLGIHWLTNAIVLAVVVAVLKNVSVDDVGALLLAALVFGLLNTFLKPILRLITAPLAILTLGLAWFGVSMVMLLLTKAFVHGFHINGFAALVEATLIVWVVNIVLDVVPGPWRIVKKR